MAQTELRKGPFDRAVFVSAAKHLPEKVKGDELTTALLAAIADAGLDAAESRLVVLDPTAFSLLNGVDSETRIAVSAALGLGRPEGWTLDLAWPAPLAAAYASSCIFALVNTQRRGYAVAAATDLLAWQRVAEIPNVAADEDLALKVKANVLDKRDELRRHLRRAFQHLVYLGEGRVASTAKLEQDNQTALDGDTVWAVLDSRDKAFGQAQFDAAVLLYQIEDRYWGKSLAHLRADFYRSPRLPLLYGGDADLKNALFTAVRQSESRIVIKDASGDIVEPGRSGDIQLSNGFTIERPASQEVPATNVPRTGPVSGPATPGDSTGGLTSKGGAAPEPGSPSPGAPVGVPTAQRRVKISLTGSAFDDETQRLGANELFSGLIDAIDGGAVSFGRLQLEFIVKSSEADKLAKAAETLGGVAHIEDL